MVYLISGMAIVIAAVGYLAPLLGGLTLLASLLLALLIITLINIRGVSVVASMDLVLTILRYLSLLIIPLGGMLAGKGEHFYPINPHQLNISAVLSQAILLTLWGFVGLETVIATTGISNNPRRTAHLAIIVGTSFVVVLHLLNSVCMMTAVSGRFLATNSAPYVEVTRSISGPGWDIATSFIVFISCIATLNCEVMVERQVGYAAAQAGLFSNVFAITNQYNFPYVNILLIFFLKVALLLMALSQGLVTQFTTIINVAVIDYLFIYILCLVAFIKLNRKKNKLYSWMALLSLLLFCWLVVTGFSKDIWLGVLPILTGLPLYLWQTGKWKIWENFRLVRKREIAHYNPFSYPYQLA
ncbi:MAG: APC family permease [Candidatus Amoebophilus sp.]